MPLEEFNKKLDKNSLYKTQILSINVSGQVATNRVIGFHLEMLDKYIAVQVGTEYSKRKKIVRAFYIYELIYEFDAV